MKEYFDNVYKLDLESFHNDLKNNLSKNIKTFIITANPESYMISLNNKKLSSILKNKNYKIMCDGIGVKMALKKCDIEVTKMPGIEIVYKLFELGNDLSKTIYLYGGREDVILNLVKVVNESYPNLKIVGYKNGYTKDDVLSDIINLKPDILMVALGIPKQEEFIDKCYKKLPHGVMIGVGGSFDVISGLKKRAPKLIRKLNMEWLYRILKEPNRIKRFLKNNIKFALMIKKASKM